MVKIKIVQPTVDEYLASCKKECLPLIQQIRELVVREVPEVIEKNNWGTPTYLYYGILFQMTACNGYVGFSLCSEGVDLFEKRLQEYRKVKSTIHLPVNKQLDETLLKDIIKYRMRQNESMARR